MVSSTRDNLRDCYYIEHVSRLGVHDIDVNLSIVDKGAYNKKKQALSYWVLFYSN